MPGGAPQDELPPADIEPPTPLISDHHAVPPLWPLLGRAVTPPEDNALCRAALARPPSLTELQSMAMDDATADELMKADDILNW